MKFENLQSKIFNIPTITEKIKEWNKMKIVFTNGCYDILHLGHIYHLMKSSELGDKLIVGLNTDNSIKRIKGEQRPINNEYARGMSLASFNFIDAIIFFNEDTPYELIKQIKPNIITKGGDYIKEKVIGFDISKVVIIPFLEGYSTSNLINNL